MQFRRICKYFIWDDVEPYVKPFKYGHLELFRLDNNNLVNYIITISLIVTNSNQAFVNNNTHFLKNMLKMIILYILNSKMFQNIANLAQIIQFIVSNSQNCSFKAR